MGQGVCWEADVVVQVAYAGCLVGNGGGDEENGMNSRSNYELDLGDTECEVPVRHGEDILGRYKESGAQ